MITQSLLAVAVEREIVRLARERGAQNAPMGGWRNTAITTIARQERMNPYALDRLIRSEPGA